MFKKTQKYLLLNHPLLWNTKMAPASIILLTLHLIFFIIGYINGTIDFSNTRQNYNSNDDVIITFSVLISILVVIIWLVYYFKNNAFKSYYPKSNFALLKEWLLILLICFLASSFSISYYLGKNLKIRGYYTENEARKRCETLSKASIFYGESFDNDPEIDSMVNDTMRTIRLDYMVFNKKKYPLESLINKDIENYSFFDSTWDSLTKVKVKNWLVNNQTDSVKVVMKKYFAIVKEHQLKSNIDENKWFTLIYNPPTFEQKNVIAKRERDFYNNGNYDYEYDYSDPATTAYIEQPSTELDSLNEYIKFIGKDKYVYYKSYVPASQLEFNYEKISYAHTDTLIPNELALGIWYFAMVFSILIFSFKVTSGRYWLIALVSLGLLNIILGIVTAVSNSEYYYLIGLLLTTILLFCYLIFVIIRKTKKGISGITLNALLWLTPAFIPIVFQLLIDFLRWKYGYYNYYNGNYDYPEAFNYDKYPLLKFMEDNGEAMLWFNLLFILVMFGFYSVQIKKWKALSDN